MKIINNIPRVTTAEYKVLRELYNNFPDAFRALPLLYQEAFWTALYQPILRLKD